jgi:peptidoglycan/LPS O-acetylase OafA/YrhL
LNLTPDKVASPGAFRLALAFAVFVHHTTYFNVGMAAVLVFFILSGYWVATMWNRVYSKTYAAYYTYMVSRVWRIVPVFALCSLVSWALLAWRGDAPESAGSLVHQVFSNVLILGYNSLPFQANIPAWSLDMELQFYLIAPLIVFLFSKNVRVFFLFVAISLVAQRYGASTTVAPFLYLFGIGVASAAADLKPGRNLAYVSLYATAGVLFVGALLLVKDVALGEKQGADLVAFGNTMNIVIAVLLIPWALYTVRQRTGPTDRMLGDLSYIFYLLHWSVLGAMKTGEGSYFERFVLCSEALVLILVASYAIWRYFDHPISKMRSAWVAKRLTPDEAEVEAPEEPPGLVRVA